MIIFRNDATISIHKGSEGFLVHDTNDSQKMESVLVAGAVPVNVQLCTAGRVPLGSAISWRLIQKCTLPRRYALESGSRILPVTLQGTK